MKISKFIKILKQSIGCLDGLGEAPLKVEFAHKNLGMRHYHLAKPYLRDGRVFIQLSESCARCKPSHTSQRERRR